MGAVVVPELEFGSLLSDHSWSRACSLHCTTWVVCTERDTSRDDNICTVRFSVYVHFVIIETLITVDSDLAVTRDVLPSSPP